MNKVIRSIHERRSIRKYQDKSIPRKYIDEILEAGLHPLPRTGSRGNT